MKIITNSWRSCSRRDYCRAGLSLCWQFAASLCDVASLGGAANRPNLDDLALLLRYPRILAIFDSDPAGDQARAELKSFPRITTITPPAHDLSDYWRETGRLYTWLAGLFS